MTRPRPRSSPSILRRLPPTTARLRELGSPAECAAVVKADAYGLGMAEIAPALARAGCKTFFVATLGEAAELRALLPDATIYVFGGLLTDTACLPRVGLAPRAEQRR